MVLIMFTFFSILIFLNRSFILFMLKKSCQIQVKTSHHIILLQYKFVPVNKVMYKEGWVNLQIKEKIFSFINSILMVAVFKRNFSY